MKHLVTKIPLRVVLYAKDVEKITGRSDRTARRLLQNIRTALGKRSSSFVTVKEFCFFYGIDEESIKDFLELETPLETFYFSLLTFDFLRWLHYQNESWSIQKMLRTLPVVSAGQLITFLER